MTITTPQRHINEAEMRDEQAIAAGLYALIIISMIAVGLIASAVWTGLVQNHIETRLEQEK